MAKRIPDDVVSEEQMFADDLERLDREQPGWDRDAKIARAQSGLQIGTKREVLVSVYGEELVAEAEARNANEGK